MPSDRSLSGYPEPGAELRACLGLLQGPPVQGALAVAAMLASEYADTDLLYELPASEVLAGQQQAHRVAAALITLLGEQPELWNAWVQLAGHPARGATFAEILLSPGRRGSERGGEHRSGQGVPCGQPDFSHGVTARSLP